MDRKAIGKHKKLKRGSYWHKHRGHVSRWLQCVLSNRPRPKSPRHMYDSVGEAFRDHRRR